MTVDPFDLQAQARAQAQDTERQEQARAVAVADLRSIASSYQGRRFLRWILQRSWVFQQPFDRDPIVMARTVGRQEIGRELLNRLTHDCFDLYGQILEDQKADDRAAAETRTDR